MAGVSRITLIGNLGRDPETGYTPSGRLNVKMTVAVNRKFRTQGGEQQEQTSWFRVTAWGTLAESLDKLSQNGYLAKGKQVYVEGRLEAREYQDKDGQTRTSLDVSASEFQLLGSRGDSDGGYGGDRGDAGADRGGYDRGGSGGGGDRGRSAPQRGGGGGSRDDDEYDAPGRMDEVPF